VSLRQAAAPDSFVDLFVEVAAAAALFVVCVTPLVVSLTVYGGTVVLFKPTPEGPRLIVSPLTTILVGFAPEPIV